MTTILVSVAKPQRTLPAVLRRALKGYLEGAYGADELKGIRIPGDYTYGPYAPFWRRKMNNFIRFHRRQKRLSRTRITRPA